jgi:hypothetical protein
MTCKNIHKNFVRHVQKWWIFEGKKISASRFAREWTTSRGEMEQPEEPETQLINLAKPFFSPGAICQAPRIVLLDRSVIMPSLKHFLLRLICWTPNCLTSSPRNVLAQQNGSKKKNNSKSSSFGRWERIFYGLGTHCRPNERLDASEETEARPRTFRTSWEIFLVKNRENNAFGEKKNGWPT